MKSGQCVTAGELRERFSYNPQTGDFVYLLKSNSNVNIGDIAGCVETNGYLRIRINGRLYGAHRLAWLYVHGEMPTWSIDHRNGVRTDNRIENLRHVTPSENSQNMTRPMKNNKVGLLGVTIEDGRFVARIKDRGLKLRLGPFDTAELAHEAYLKEKRVRHVTCTI